MSYIAFQEAFRVLRSGGLLYIAEGVINPESFEKLPRSVRAINDISLAINRVGYRSYLEKLGFEIKVHEIVGEGTLDPNEGDFPGLALKYGVRIKYHGVYIVARKPGSS